MGKIENIKKFFINKKFRRGVLASHGFLRCISDKKFVEKGYYIRTGKRLNLDNPTTYNDKLNWIKIYDHNPLYTTMVDKYEVKKYAAEIIGEEYIIPTLGVWDKFKDIDFDSLPDQFVLKCTHDSGGLVICKDKSKLDIKAAKKKINKSLRRNYYDYGREWPYKNVKPRIIAEKFMTDGSGGLVDYKTYNVDGKSYMCLVCLDRHLKQTKFHFVSKDWELLRYTKVSKDAPEGWTPEKPASMDKMYELAEKLSVGLPFARVDFYDVDGHPYLGEITFFPDGGIEMWNSPKFQAYMGDIIDLSQCKYAKKDKK